MKILKALSFAVILTTFAVVPAFTQQQQEEECKALYKKYIENYKGTLAQRKTAVEAADQFIAKCASLDADVTKYLERVLPPIKQKIAAEESAIKKKIDFAATVQAFDNAVKDPKNINANAAFSTGKRLLNEHDPNLIDVMLVLASIGFDQAAANPPVNTYNSEAINYAKQTIQKIDAGTTSQQYGAWSYAYKTKENALAWMNYTIGYITYFNQKNPKAALSFLYKATMYEAGGKDNPRNLPIIYQAIGDYYRDEYNNLDDERGKLFAQAKDKTPEEAKPLADKTRELLLLQKAYADRLIDAYGRAWTLASNDQAYKNALYGNLKVLYGFRFDGKTDGLDSYISGLISQPMPDPSTPVTAISDAMPAR